MKNIALFCCFFVCHISQAQNIAFQKFLDAFPVVVAEANISELLACQVFGASKPSAAPQKLAYLNQEANTIQMPCSKYKTEAGLHIVSVIERLTPQDSIEYHLLYVFDAQGKLCSKIKTGYKTTNPANNAYNHAQIAQKNGVLQLKLYEGKYGYIPNIDEGTETIYALNSVGEWQKLKERPYRDKIVPN